MSHQSIPYVIVECDGDGCNEEHPYSPNSSAGFIRKKKVGWLYKDRKDYCPKCRRGV